MIKASSRRSPRRPTSFGLRPPRAAASRRATYACTLVVGVLAGGFAPGARAQVDQRQAAAIQRACAVKALPPSECPGREGAASASRYPGRPAAIPPASSEQMFTDPSNRYRFVVPPGWTLKMQGDVPGLTQGQAWVEIVATSAESPRAAAQAVGADFQPAFSRIELVNQGNAQFGGHEGFGINAGAVTRAKGQRMSVQLMAISAGGGHDLVIVSATPLEQAQALNAGVVALANSVRFRGE